MEDTLQTRPNSGAPAAVAASNQPWNLYLPGQRWRFLGILFLVSTSNYFDRNVIAVLLEPIKHEFNVSDTMLGLLGGFCFALFYALFGLPAARWGDKGNRRTLISLALVTWSLMTALCGVAQTFWQLALARVGVGAGESGAIPPAQSLIADYFPPERRAGAIAVFLSSATAGYLLGFGAGGYVAAHYGWRMAFLVAGIPGVALAVLTWRGLDEPRLRTGFPNAGADGERLGQSLRILLRKRAYVYALVGCLLYFFMAYGALIFLPSYLIRVQHIPLATVSLAYGSASAVGALFGTLGGGWLADRLSRRDMRWLAWLPAAACALTAPLEMGGLSVERLGVFLALSASGSALLAAGLPTIFSAILAVCGRVRRATAVAIVLFSSTLFGGGFGPLVTGALSDSLSAAHGVQGLRYALLAMMPLLLVTGFFFYLCGRNLLADLEE